MAQGGEKRLSAFKMMCPNNRMIALHLFFALISIFIYGDQHVNFVSWIGFHGMKFIL
ncbi:hypothetical protein D3C87_1338120 [compost metagenome]